METVVRIFIYSLLPLLIAVGHVGFDKSAQGCERRLEILLLYLLALVLRQRYRRLLRSLLPFRIGGQIDRLGRGESRSTRSRFR
jgi:hypothetical protein